VTEAEIDNALDRLEAAGSIEFARQQARGLVRSGKNHLNALPDNRASDLLDSVADYLIEREY
jgi:geranylgeranyl diphosphate synthase type I